MPDDFSVAKSRAKRVERIQSRFRDRGGVFVPETHNPLLDKLLARGVNGESPTKAQRRKSILQGSPVSRRKSVYRGHDRDDGVDGGAEMTLNKVVAKPRKSIGAGKAPPKPRKSIRTEKAALKPRKSVGALKPRKSAGQAKKSIDAVETGETTRDMVEEKAGRRKSIAATDKKRSTKVNGQPEVEDVDKITGGEKMPSTSTHHLSRHPHAVPTEPQEKAKGSRTATTGKKESSIATVQHAKDSTKPLSNKKVAKPRSQTARDHAPLPSTQPAAPKHKPADAAAAKPQSRRAIDDAPLSPVASTRPKRKPANATVSTSRVMLERSHEELAPLEAIPSSDSDTPLMYMIQSAQWHEKKRKAAESAPEPPRKRLRDTNDDNMTGKHSKSERTTERKGSRSKAHNSKAGGKLRASQTPLHSTMDSMEIDEPKEIDELRSKNERMTDRPRRRRSLPQLPNSDDEEMLAGSSNRSTAAQRPRGAAVKKRRREEKEDEALMEAVQRDEEEDEAAVPPRKRPKVPRTTAKKASRPAEALVDIPRGNGGSKRPTSKSDGAKPASGSSSKKTSQTRAAHKSNVKTAKRSDGKENRPPAAAQKAVRKLRPKPRPRLSMFPAPPPVVDADDDPIDFLS
ncbi:uncharacterized protein LAESUDRAFT_729338 [Laetiporus sulphureus 93-53]|uniref:Uncharacterized protein n=1 Tax=Laetiporus sulphureus 93-53 TaxID=1314785 RepID=A0A165CRK2_9APHY|nr:uncharacterized protein LAESUDRAFT_729338 [Laetiporus sulphureus 93-53]KZT03303.1 hypothetical protein LAESUDRAFT_729338 [Laetiporus sulphureus 93-53]